MFVFGLTIEAEVRIQSNDSLSLSSPFRIVTQLIFKVNPICYFRLLLAFVIWTLFFFFANYGHAIGTHLSGKAIFRGGPAGAPFHCARLPLRKTHILSKNDKVHML